MLKEITATFISISIIYSSLLSQTSDYDLNKKYWYYKTRFNNDFVVVDTGKGCSLPLNSREFDYAQGSSGFYPGPSHTIKTGDATTQLGIYLGVLATEYRLLKNKGGQDAAIAKVKHELYCALNALNGC